MQLTKAADCEQSLAEVQLEPYGHFSHNQLHNTQFSAKHLEKLTQRGPVTRSCLKVSISESVEHCKVKIHSSWLQSWHSYSCLSVVIVFGSVLLRHWDWELMASGSAAVRDSDDVVEVTVAEALDSDDDVEVAASKNKTGLVSIGHGLSHGSRPLNASLAKAVEPVPDSQCPDDSQLPDSPPQDTSWTDVYLLDSPPFSDFASPRRPALKRSNQFDGTPEGMEASRKGDGQSVEEVGPTGYDSDSTLALGDEQRTTQVTVFDDAVEAVTDDKSHHDVEVVTDDKSHHDVENAQGDQSPHEAENEKGDEDEKPDKASDADTKDLLKDPKFKKGTKMKDLSPNSQETLKRVRKARNVQLSSAWHNKYASKGVLKSSGAAGADGAEGSSPADPGESVHAEPVRHADPAAPYQPLTLKDARATWLQYPF